MYRNDEVARNLEQAQTLVEGMKRAKKAKEEKRRRAVEREKRISCWFFCNEYDILAYILLGATMVCLLIYIPARAAAVFDTIEGMNNKATCFNTCSSQQKPVDDVEYKVSSCICMRDGKPDTRAFLKGK